tara:strand:- start:819 stop:1058 length:240 start_codon:yes stop_codon:yes gene_type:complete
VLVVEVLLLAMVALAAVEMVLLAVEHKHRLVKQILEVVEAELVTEVPQLLMVYQKMVVLVLLQLNIGIPTLIMKQQVEQ